MQRPDQQSQPPLRLWLFAPSLQPADLDLFRRLNIRTVILPGNPEAVAQAKDAGLRVYAFLHAFPEGNGENTLSVDVHGQDQSWFSSGCMNRPAVRRRFAENLQRLAQLEGIDGVFLDGCRFSSPASSATLGALFTCFCPDCHRRMLDCGLDPLAVRRDVLRLDRLRDGCETRLARRLGAITGRAELEAELPGIRGWLDFRSDCVRSALEQARSILRKPEPARQLGICSFFPAISPLVGQRYNEMDASIDWFMPMLYRRFDRPQGPACMDHELARLANALATHPEIGPAQALRILRVLTDFPADRFANPQELMTGLTIGDAVGEARRVADIAGNARTVPVIWLKDRDVEGHLAAFVDIGIGDIAFYDYDREKLRELADRPEVQGSQKR